MPTYIICYNGLDSERSVTTNVTRKLMLFIKICEEKDSIQKSYLGYFRQIHIIQAFNFGNNGVTKCSNMCNERVQ